MLVVMYPLNSTDSEVTYRYSCKDVDATLQYPENSNREETYLTLLINGYIQQSDIGVEPDGNNHEITITIPEKDVTYALTYNKNINKVKSSVYQTVTMISQKFEGVIDGNSIDFCHSMLNKYKDKIVTSIKKYKEDVRVIEL